MVLVSSTVDLRDMPVEEGYKGPRMQGEAQGAGCTGHVHTAYSMCIQHVHTHM